MEWNYLFIPKQFTNGLEIAYPNFWWIWLLIHAGIKPMMYM